MLNTDADTPTPPPEPQQKLHNTQLPQQIFLMGTGKRRRTRRAERLFQGKGSKVLFCTSAVPAKLCGCSLKNVFPCSRLFGRSPAGSQRGLGPHTPSDRTRHIALLGTKSAPSGSRTAAFLHQHQALLPAPERFSQ